MSPSPATCCQLAFTSLLTKHYRLSYFSTLAYMHTLCYIHTHPHTPMCAHLHSPTHTFTWEHMHPHMYTCTHAPTQSPMHTYYGHTHTCTPAPTQHTMRLENPMYEENCPRIFSCAVTTRNLLPAAPNPQHPCFSGLHPQCRVLANMSQLHRCSGFRPTVIRPESVGCGGIISHSTAPGSSPPVVYQIT